MTTAFCIPLHPQVVPTTLKIRSFNSDQNFQEQNSHDKQYHFKRQDTVLARVVVDHMVPLLN